MKYVAIANLKGGVGKSTTTMMLADSIAQFHDKSVLVLDLDPQSNCSFMFLGRAGAETNEHAGRTLLHFLDQLGSGAKINLSKFVSPSASDLVSLVGTKRRGQVALISSSPHLWSAESKFERAAMKKGLEADALLAEAIRHYLEKIHGTYDVVIFDCPPGFSVLARAGIRMADVVVSPTISDDTSARSLKDFVEIGLKQMLRKDKPHYVVVTRYVQNRLTETTLDRLRTEYQVIGSPIKYSVDVVRACYRSRHDSFRSFNEKYGAQQNSVKDLGAAFIRILNAHGGRHGGKDA